MLQNDFENFLDDVILITHDVEDKLIKYKRDIEYFGGDSLFTEYGGLIDDSLKDLKRISEVINDFSKRADTIHIENKIYLRS